jgi:hypothetical protein
MGRHDPLFLLIKSLSAGEKAAVRSADKGQAGYIVLFDLIARQREYDERKVRKKLQQQNVDINFSYAKNYLTKHILRILRDPITIGSGDGTTAGIQAQVQEIEILVDRKIYDLASKMLAKARKTAWDSERWEAFIRLSQIEISLLAMESGNPEDSLQKIRAINAERRQARDHQVNLGEYEDIYHEYRPVLMRKQRARNEWDLQLNKEFSEHPLMQAVTRAQSQRARRMYYRSRILIHNFAAEFEETFKLLEASLDQYRRHEFLLNDYPVDYVNDLLRHGILLAHYGKHAQVEKTLKEIRAFQQKRGIHGSEIFDKYYRLLLGHAIATGDYARVNAEIDDIRAGLDLYAESLPWAIRCNILFLLGRVAFEQKDFKAAAAWLNAILDETNRGIREDLVSLSRILLIFVYYERGEFDLVESGSRATRKYLRRREQLYKFESRILSFLEHNSFHVTTSAEAEALRTLRSDLKVIFEDKLEANILAFFDILGWLDGKIAGLEG